MKMKQALFAAVPVMMMGLVVSGAKGQLRPCPDIDQVTGYNVLLGKAKKETNNEKFTCCL